MLIIRLPQEIENKLVQLGKRTGKSKSSYVKEIILKHLEDSLIAESAYNNFKESGEKGIPLEEILKKYKIHNLSPVEKCFSEEWFSREDEEDFKNFQKIYRQ